MLEKNEKKLNFDAHFHYFYCKKLGILDFPDNWQGISCAHSLEEWEIQSLADERVLQAYGIHPQDAGNQWKNYKDQSVLFLEKLIKENRIAGIGEAGFDFFNDEYKACAKEQEYYFNLQLELAVEYQLPLIIHCRKANEKLFEYSRKLSQLPEVLFHSFMGTPVEALSLLKKDINGYFSFGKQIFNNNKKVISCVKEIPGERVLGETDAPYQYLKGEKFTTPGEIVKILEGIEKLQQNK